MELKLNRDRTFLSVKVVFGAQRQPYQKKAIAFF
jgi:hypothetical protein